MNNSSGGSNLEYLKSKVGLEVSRTWSCSRSSQSEISLPDNDLGGSIPKSGS